MKKTLIFMLSVLAMVLCAGVVNAAIPGIPGITVNETSFTISVETTDNIDKELNITNTGATNTDINLTYDELELEHISDGEADKVELTIDGPSKVMNDSSDDLDISGNNLDTYNDYKTGTYTGSFKIYNKDNTSQFEEISVILNLAKKEILTASTIDSISAKEGTSVSFEFDLDNDGNSDLSGIKYELDDLEKGSEELDVSNIEWENRESSIDWTEDIDDVKLSFNIDPISDTAKFGTYTGNIVVTYGDNDEELEIPLSINVQARQHSLSIPSEIVLGSSTQDRGTTATKAFRITNNGDYTESVRVKYTPVNSNSNYTIEGQKVSTEMTLATLSPNGYTDLDLTYDIAQDFSSGKTKIGTLDIKYSNDNGGDTIVTKDVYVQVETNLEVEITKFKFAGDNVEPDNEGDTQTADDVDYGEDIEMEFEVKNKFSSSDDIDFEYTNLEVTIEGIDDGGDMEFEEDIGDLDAGDEERVKFEADIPRKIEDGTYKVIIHAEADEKDSGITHEFDYEFSISVELEEDAITILKAELDDTTVDCDRETDLIIQIANTGSNDQDEASISVDSDELNIDWEKLNLDMPSDYDDDDNMRTFRLPIDATDVEEDDYTITIRTFDEDGSETDRKDLTLEVKKCETEEDSEEVEVITGDDTETESEDDTEDTSDITPIDESEFEDESSIFDSENLKIGLLIGVNAILVIGAIVVVFKFLL